ncbi:MAG: hypothetical protein K2N51_12095 [Lachnospiraceae bacterium]|nr:hypothetical protein [Lachnospiraceae bacterium]
MRKLQKKLVFIGLFVVMMIGGVIFFISKAKILSSDDNAALITQYMQDEKRNKTYKYPDYAKCAGVPEKYFYTPGVYHFDGEDGDENGGYYIETIQTKSDAQTDYYTNHYIFWEYTISDPGGEGQYLASFTVVEASGKDFKIGARKNKSGEYKPIVTIDLTNHGSKEVNPEVIKAVTISEIENNKIKKYDDEDKVGNIMCWPTVDLDADLDTILDLTPVYHDVTWGECRGDAFLYGTDYDSHQVVKKIGAGVNGKGYKKGLSIQISALTTYTENGTPKVIYKKGDEERCASVDYEFDIINSSGEVLLSVCKPFPRKYIRD